MNNFIQWMMAVLAVTFITVFVVALVVVLVTEEPVPERTCKRLLVAVPVPLDDNLVAVSEMQVCGTNLEFNRIRPWGMRGLTT